MSTILEQKDSYLQKINAKRFWLGVFERRIMLNLIGDVYHARGAELKEKFLERLLFVSTVQRLPLLKDPIFSKFRRNMSSEKHRQNIVEEEVWNRTSDYRQRVLTGDLVVFDEVSQIMIPMSLEESPGPQTRLLLSL